MLPPDVVEAWFRPRSILVVGASKTRPAQGNMFIRRQQAFGFTGPIHVVHPDGGTVEGLSCLRSVGELAEPVDYTFLAVPARSVADVLRAGAGKLRVVQVLSSGFRELGPDGARLEADLMGAARSAGIRVIGPNCFGSYSPAGALTMMPDAPREAGDVGFVAQSGGLSCEVIAAGAAIGVRFSQVVALGNCADIDTMDVLDHFVSDPGTRSIGMYLEQVHRPPEFVRLLRAAEGRKPIVLMKGGSTREGGRAARSHTGAMTTDARVVEGVAAQHGVALVPTPEALAQVMACHRLAGARPLQGPPRCALIGPGGGLGVLTVDAFSRAGLAVPRFSDRARDLCAASGLPMEGSGLGNPVDVSVMTLSSRPADLAARLFGAVGAAAEVDWVVAHIHLPNLFALTPDPCGILEAYVSGLIAARRAHPDLRWALVLRSSGAEAFEAVRSQQRASAVASGIPVFERLEDAAGAIAALARFETHPAPAGPAGDNGRGVRWT